ncbi:MAG TPA: NAD(P)-dependent oxidoreductase [bacterium]|nr:NAD(P)-dependent oxidoreductase [bacterium]
MNCGETLILGADGQLGRALARLLPDATAWTEREFDLGEPAALLAKLRTAAPATVINCAALTDVDACEREPVRALAVNALGVQPLAAWQRERGCRVVHLSTDYLFDGTARTPYPEAAAPRPLSVYGVSKWLGERWLDAEQSLVVRTSTLLGPGPASFVTKVRDWSAACAASGRPLRVVADVVAAPTLVGDLARALVQLLRDGVTGTVNIINAGACSRADLARFILAACGAGVAVADARQAEFSNPARRPVYSELALDRLRELGITMRPWQEALGEMLQGGRS